MSIDSSGNVHDNQGRFAGQVQPEADTGEVLPADGKRAKRVAEIRASYAEKYGRSKPSELSCDDCGLDKADDGVTVEVRGLPGRPHLCADCYEQRLDALADERYDFEQGHDDSPSLDAPWWADR